MAYLFWVHFCFVFFVCRFLKRGQIDDQCLFVLFFGFKIVLSFYLCKLFFCQLPSKKFMSRSDKEGFFVCLFFVQLKVGDDANIFVSVFVFVSIFLIILEVVNWFLLDWRLQDYYGNFGKVSSRQGLQSYHKSFFEWIIWWWSLRVFVCLMLTVGVAQPTRLPRPLRAGHLR